MIDRAMALPSRAASCSRRPGVSPRGLVSSVTTSGTVPERSASSVTASASVWSRGSASRRRPGSIRAAIPAGLIRSVCQLSATQSSGPPIRAAWVRAKKTDPGPQTSWARPRRSGGKGREPMFMADDTIGQHRLPDKAMRYAALILMAIAAAPRSPMRSRRPKSAMGGKRHLPHATFPSTIRSGPVWPRRPACRLGRGPSMTVVLSLWLPTSSRGPNCSPEDGLTILVIMRDGPPQGDRAWPGSVFLRPVSWRSSGPSR